MLPTTHDGCRFRPSSPAVWRDFLKGRGEKTKRWIKHILTTKFCVSSKSLVVFQQLCHGDGGVQTDELVPVAWESSCCQKALYVKKIKKCPSVLKRTQSQYKCTRFIKSLISCRYSLLYLLSRTSVPNLRSWKAFLSLEMKSHLKYSTQMYLPRHNPQT